MDDGVQLFLRSERQAVDHGLSECSTWWLEAWLCPIYARNTPPIMSTICVFPVPHNDARVQEGAAYGP
jgi:hypothetical protein